MKSSDTWRLCAVAESKHYTSLAPLDLNWPNPSAFGSNDILGWLDISKI
jgi:hypothetical protein